MMAYYFFFFFFQAEDGIRDKLVTGVQTCALPISFEDRVFDEVADAVPVSRLVARAAPDPDAHGGGAKRWHVLRQDGQPVGESLYLNLFDHYPESFSENLSAGTLSEP